MANEERVRAQKQKFLHRPAEGVYGDCHRTAIAVCLGLDRDEVPHFMEGGPATEPKAEIQAWLAARGLVGIDLVYPRETALDDILSSLAHLNPGVPFILGGQSKNGTNHSVVCLDGEVVCDPALDDAGIVGPMDDGYWWVTYFGARAIAALPVQVAGKPVAWLRDAQPDAEDEAMVVCNRIDPGAIPVFASPPAPASQVLTEEERAVVGIARAVASRLGSEQANVFPVHCNCMMQEGQRAIAALLAIIDRLTNKDTEHG